MLLIINKILGCKGNLIKIEFEVDNKEFIAYVPDDQYWISVKDILLNREYEYLPEFELSNFRNGIIVDAGAHVGLFSLVASCFAKKVIAIEANPINYKLLELNLLNNNIKNVVPINKAIWIKDNGRLKLYVGGHTGGHSIYGNSNKYFEVETITLKRICEEFNLDKIDLLKIDIEGAEFKIFDKMDRNIADKIDKIVGEVHLNHGNLSDIVKNLSNLGFMVLYYTPPIYKNNANYEINLKNMYRLKFLRRLIYQLVSLLKIRDKSLAIMFAIKT